MAHTTLFKHYNLELYLFSTASNDDRMSVRFAHPKQKYLINIVRKGLLHKLNITSIEDHVYGL